MGENVDGGGMMPAELLVAGLCAVGAAYLGCLYARGFRNGLWKKYVFPHVFFIGAIAMDIGFAIWMLILAIGGI
jgi:hypothetical protein